MSETSTEPEVDAAPMWAVDALAGMLYDAEHHPAQDDDSPVCCYGCSEAQEGFVVWPCPVVSLLPERVRKHLEAMAAAEGRIGASS